MKKVCLALLTVTSCFSQVVYTASKTTTLSSSAEVVTVQQPASGNKTVNFVSAYVDSTTACSFVIERDGTAANATSLTIANGNPGQNSPTTTGYSASNVGVGTVITRAGVSGGGAVVVDLSKINMDKKGTGYNLTVRTAACTGVVNIVITYTER